MTNGQEGATESTGPIWFSGNYGTWKEAQRESVGYDAPAILQKVRDATLKVVSGEAAFERDGVAFAKLEHSLPLLVCLLYIASRAGNRLSLLDFGGSLGSSYWQNREFLRHLETLRWSVVDQPHFVKTGQSEIATDVLRFYPSLSEAVASGSPNAALLSSVLPYMERPFDTFGSVLSYRLPFVVVDRTPFFEQDLPDRICIERIVDPTIYEGSYPAWFFNLDKFRRFVRDSGYHAVGEFDSWERWQVQGTPAQSKCFLLEPAQR